MALRLLEIKKIRETVSQVSVRAVTTHTVLALCPPARAVVSGAQVVPERTKVSWVLTLAWVFFKDLFVHLWGSIPPKFIRKKYTKHIHSQPIVPLGFKTVVGEIGGDPTFHASLDLSTRFSASNVPKRKPMTSLRWVGVENTKTPNSQPKRIARNFPNSRS